MNLFVDLQQLIMQYLAPHRRQANRLSWLNALIDLKETFEEFFVWRDKYRHKIQITSQAIVLEAHLNNLFGEFQFAIRNYPNTFVPIGNNDEGSFYWIPFDNHGGSITPYVPFALTDETSIHGFSDFYVEISEKKPEEATPATDSTEKDPPLILTQKTKARIRLEVNRYRQANKKFDLIINNITEE